MNFNSIGDFWEHIKNPITLIKYLNSQAVIAFIALLFGIFTYIYVVDFYGQDFHVFRGLPFGLRNYSFYSGNEGLTYNKIGSLLQNAELPNVKLVNIPTKGSIENVNKIIANEDPSVGLAQRFIANEDEVTSNQVEYVTPILLDRFYILYNIKKFNDSLKNSDPHPPIISFSEYTDISVLKFFGASKINIGAQGSGTKIISSYFLDEINRQLTQSPRISESLRLNQKLTENNFELAYKELVEGKIDALFAMTGCMQKAIDKNQIGLANISPGLVSMLNAKYNLQLKPVSFEPDGADSISTFGGYTYLIADKRVPTLDLNTIVHALDVDKLNFECPQKEKTEKKSLLTEFAFYEYYQKQQGAKSIRALRNILLFIVTISSSFFLAFISLSQLVSFTLQSRYIKKIAIIAQKIPDNAEWEEPSNLVMLITPRIDINQVRIINTIIQGITELIELRVELCDETGLTDFHFTFLQGRIDQIMDKLRKSLFIRLNEVKETGGLASLTNGDIRKYFTADWITEEAYNALRTTSP